MLIDGKHVPDDLTPDEARFALEHGRHCKFRTAMLCPVDVQCDLHDEPVCPKCDACSCSKPGEPLHQRTVEFFKIRFERPNRRRA